MCWFTVLWTCCWVMIFKKFFVFQKTSKAKIYIIHFWDVTVTFSYKYTHGKNSCYILWISPTKYVLGCDYSLPTLPSDHIPHQPVPESRHTQVADCDNRWNSGVFNLMQSDYLGRILLLITGKLSFKMRCETIQVSI